MAQSKKEIEREAKNALKAASLAAKLAEKEAARSQKEVERTQKLAEKEVARAHKVAQQSAPRPPNAGEHQGTFFSVTNSTMVSQTVIVETNGNGTRHDYVEKDGVVLQNSTVTYYRP